MTAAPRKRATTTRKGPTQTQDFGSGRREAHDASAFYARFVAPEISDDTTVERPTELDVIYTADARAMTRVADNSVALVVTSPPYFAGKQYEQSLGVGGVPANYFEYLQLLRDVFDECKRVLEPGGRIAVNVANLGRRPYRSLSADVVDILSDLGLLLRGEVVWWKGRAAGGSCAWGSFASPANPVLRDITERVVVASKGRFDRALPPLKRAKAGLPHTATISREEFMEATTDLWELAPESATRVGHPAPFPVELPQRFIELYTYAGDVVLDPFMGSGSTAVAALRTGRHYLGFDTDDNYAQAARDRACAEAARLRAERDPVIPPLPLAVSEAEPDPVTAAIREGRQAKDVARALLESCGFGHIRDNVKPRGLGVAIPLVATDQTGTDWAFDIAGAFTTSRAGLRRADTLWRCLGTASVLHEAGLGLPLVVLTTDAPAKGSAGARALAAVRGPNRPIFDVVQLANIADQERLRAHAKVGPTG